MITGGRKVLLEELVERAARCTTAVQGDTNYSAAQPMPSLTVFRREVPSAIEATLYHPVLCLILHGRKEVSLGDETFSFGRGECLLVSHVLPVESRITEAPYMALVFAVDVATIRSLQAHDWTLVADVEPRRAAEARPVDRELLGALCRYIALADSPMDAKVLGPMLVNEIHYRLLTAPFGGMLRDLIRYDSHASAIGRAMGHIRADIRARIEVAKLARRVGMSASSFHKHFKWVTSTTPLQYQKELRLIEARRLLRTGCVSVSSAAFDVGYQSLSQFSREYTRKFGLPPSREMVSSPTS